MARVPANRSKRVVHECPICGKESVPHDGAMHEATAHLLDLGWSWTSALSGADWHLVCQTHKQPGEPQTLYVDTTADPTKRKKYIEGVHGRADTG